jgi:predicted nucleotidyltransferase
LDPETRDRCREWDEDIIRAFKPLGPKKIILFGSWARGDADPFSDIDVIVVYPTDKRFLDRLEELYRLWNLPRPADILAYTPQEFEQLAVERDFVRSAVEKGRPIYEDA